MEISATNMIIDNTIDWLTSEMKDKPEEVKAGTVRAGRLQDDPTKFTGINILVNDDTESDSGALAKPSTDGRLGAPAYMIGGATHQVLCFKIDLVFHFKGEADRVVARRKCHVLVSRLRRALKDMPLPKHPVTSQPKDDFGEVIVKQELGNYTLIESGGPGHYIWTGNIAFSYLTSFS